MSLTFPDTPSLNERFIYNDKIYTWNGTKWVTGPIGNKLISGEYRNIFYENQETFVTLDTQRYNFFDITTITPNLLVNTQDFSNGSWVKNNGSITTNTTVDPVYGELTADSFIETNGNALQKNITQSFSFVSGTRYTMSIHAKAIGSRHIALIFPDSAYGSYYDAYFDLFSGSVTLNANATSGGAVATITKLENGWYRCTFSATATITSYSSIQYRLLDSPTVINLYTGDGVSGLYLWGAQCEISSVASPYNNANTNLLKHTQAFSNNFTWTRFGGSIVDNTTYDPVYGQLTADSFIETSGHTTEKYTIQAASFFAGTRYTLSVYAKPIGNRHLSLIFPSTAFGGSFYIAFFDLSTGTSTMNTAATSGGATVTITPAIDGWYRCTFSATAITTVLAEIQYRILNNSINTNNYTGDGVSGLYLWGAQFEVGSTASKYKRVGTTPYYNLFLSNTSVYDKILVKLNVGGLNTVEWNTIPSNIIWSEGTAPTIVQNKIIMIEFQKFKDQWYGYVLTKNVSI